MNRNNQQRRIAMRLTGTCMRSTRNMSHCDATMVRTAFDKDDDEIGRAIKTIENMRSNSKAIAEKYQHI